MPIRGIEQQQHTRARVDCFTTRVAREDTADPGLVVAHLHEPGVLLRIAHGVQRVISERRERNDSLKLPASVAVGDEATARVTIADVRPVGITSTEHSIVYGLIERVGVVRQAACVVDDRDLGHAQPSGHVVELGVAPAGYLSHVPVEPSRRIFLRRVETDREDAIVKPNRSFQLQKGQIVPMGATAKLRIPSFKCAGTARTQRTTIKDVGSYDARARMEGFATDRNESESPFAGIIMPTGQRG
uniref:Uncharacterized protein n=1 Tax=Anopheles atroparvus TaxID=41427 RepID=A0A182JG36_ANOAO